MNSRDISFVHDDVDDQNSGVGDFHSLLEAELKKKIDKRKSRGRASTKRFTRQYDSVEKHHENLPSIEGILGNAKS